jgi:hypothetical protein
LEKRTYQKTKSKKKIYFNDNELLYNQDKNPIDILNNNNISDFEHILNKVHVKFYVFQYMEDTTTYHIIHHKRNKNENAEMKKNDYNMNILPFYNQYIVQFHLNVYYNMLLHIQCIRFHVLHKKVFDSFLFHIVQSIDRLLVNLFHNHHVENNKLIILHIWNIMLHNRLKYFFHTISIL